MIDQLHWVDSQGRRWSSTIRFSDAVRLKERAGIDLLDPHSLGVLFTDHPIKRIEVLAELWRTHWESLGLTYTEFADALISSNTSFSDAHAALTAGLSDFFQRLDRGDLAAVADRAAKAVAATQQLRVAAASGPKVQTILQRATQTVAAEIDARLNAALTESPPTGTMSGTLPASPG